jgi:hypothetical protein
MEIAPFTRRMHEELAACLSTYRRVTRAAPGEMAKLDRISGNLMWAEGVQRRKQAQLDDEARKRFAKYEERLRAARRAL